MKRLSSWMKARKLYLGVVAMLALILFVGIAFTVVGCSKCKACHCECKHGGPTGVISFDVSSSGGLDCDDACAERTGCGSTDNVAKAQCM